MIGKIVALAAVSFWAGMARAEMDEQNLAAVLRDMRADVKALKMNVGYPGKFLEVPKEIKARRLQKYVTRSVALRRDGELYDVGEVSPCVRFVCACGNS